MGVLSRFKIFTHKHPIVRGMVAYAVLWPISCLMQQTISGKTWDNFDWERLPRYSLYGSLYVAPTLYTWIRISSTLWPTGTLQTAVTKALVEQVTYAPFALVSFFFFMSLLEHRTVEESVNEVKTKFIPTYRVAVCFWPVVQTFNFFVIQERNRVPFVSVCSMLWCCFLAYMHQLDEKKID